MSLPHVDDYFLFIMAAIISIIQLKMGKGAWSIEWWCCAKKRLFIVFSDMLEQGNNREVFMLCGLPLIDIKPVSIMQYSSTAPQTAVSNMAIQLNQHL